MAKRTATQNSPMVDAARSDELYAEMGPAVEASGGSAANTAAGVASFGGKAAYIGRVADDTFGKVFAHDLRSAGVHFESPFASGRPSVMSAMGMPRRLSQIRSTRTVSTAPGFGIQDTPNTSPSLREPTRFRS